MENWDNNRTNNLILAILSLENDNEVKNFLRDLLTKQEIIEFGKRWQAAKMLYKKRLYSDVIKETGLSSTTVERISKWLNNGMGGYKIVLSKLAHHHIYEIEVKKGLS